jgi:hypothetical protein
MSAVQTSFVPSYAYSGTGRHVLPYVTDRELDGIMDAVCDGRLVAVAQSAAPDGSVQAQRAIVAVAAPELADELAARDADALDTLRAELKDATRELRSLRDIIGEVFREERPQDFDYRLHDAAEDVQRAFDRALDASEDL